MVELFKDSQKWDEFRTELYSWLGTPYHHLQSVKGRGADCTLFVGSCLVAINVITKLEYDYYPRDWHRIPSNEFVLDMWYKHWNKYAVPGISFDEVGINSPLQRGDILGFSTTKSGVTNHASVYVGESNLMINAINKGGVCLLTYGSWWKRKMTRHYRVFKKD